MPLLDSEPLPQSNAQLIFRTILITVLSIAILLSAAANVYFYYRNENLSEKMDSLQQDIETIKTRVGGSAANDNLERQIKDVSSQLDEISDDVTAIKSSVDTVESDVSSIESDVSSIQLKIGY